MFRNADHQFLQLDGAYVVVGPFSDYHSEELKRMVELIHQVLEARGDLS